MGKNQMNERIEKLAEQATAIVEMVGPQGYTSSYANFDREKFAELIVRECASELIRWKDEPFPYDPEFGANLIKQHFGIK